MKMPAPARVAGGLLGPLFGTERDLGLDAGEEMRVGIALLEVRLYLAVAFVELVLQPVRRLAGTVAPQLDGVHRHAVVRGVAHGVHGLGLVDVVAGFRHLLAADDAHALEHAAAFAHLLQAQHLGGAVVRRGDGRADARDARARHQHVGLFGARDLRFRDVAHLERDVALAVDVRFHVAHGNGAHGDREHLLVHACGVAEVGDARLGGRQAVARFGDPGIQGAERTGRCGCGEHARAGGLQEAAAGRGVADLPFHFLLLLFCFLAFLKSAPRPPFGPGRAGSRTPDHALAYAVRKIAYSVRSVNAFVDRKASFYEETGGVRRVRPARPAGRPRRPRRRRRAGAGGSGRLLNSGWPWHGHEPRVPSGQLHHLHQTPVGRGSPETTSPASSSRARKALFTSKRWRWRSLDQLLAVGRGRARAGPHARTGRHPGAWCRPCR